VAPTYTPDQFCATTAAGAFAGILAGRSAAEALCVAATPAATASSVASLKRIPVPPLLVVKIIQLARVAANATRPIPQGKCEFWRDSGGLWLPRNNNAARPDSAAEHGRKAVVRRTRRKKKVLFCEGVKPAD
jgi:hypothetical protein